MFRSLCVRFLLTVWNLFSPLDYILRDGLYQRPRGVSGDIKIIGIDERTLERLGPVGTWSRSYYADLLDRLNEDEETRPLVIGFDIIFPEMWTKKEIRHLQTGQKRAEMW